MPAIVDEFAALAKRHEIIYCDLIISRNRELILPVARSGRAAAGAAPGSVVEEEPTELETFFMFEPCTLRRTRRFIQPFYQEWTSRVRSSGKEKRRA